MKNILTLATILTALVGQAMAQTTFYWGSAQSEMEVSKQSEYLAERSQGQADLMWAVAQRSLIVKMDQATLNQGTSAPVPVVVLMPATNPNISLADFQSQLPASSSVATALFSESSQWPIAMAAATGQPLKTLDPQGLVWTASATLTQLLGEYPAEVSPEVVATEVATPIEFNDIQALAPAGKSYVMLLTLAAPMLGDSSGGKQSVLLIFF